MKNALLEELDLFNAAPFTVQRICELLTDPRKQYSRIDKFMRAIEKNLLVVSTVEPGRKRRDSVTAEDSEAAESIDSVINGDLSSESVDSDEQDLNFADLAEKLSSETVKENDENKLTINEEKLNDVNMKDSTTTTTTTTTETNTEEKSNETNNLKEENKIEIQNDENKKINEISETQEKDDIEDGDEELKDEKTEEKESEKIDVLKMEEETQSEEEEKTKSSETEIIKQNDDEKNIEQIKENKLNDEKEETSVVIMSNTEINSENNKNKTDELENNENVQTNEMTKGIKRCCDDRDLEITESEEHISKKVDNHITNDPVENTVTSTITEECIETKDSEPVLELNDNTKETIVESTQTEDSTDLVENKNETTDDIKITSSTVTEIENIQESITTSSTTTTESEEKVVSDELNTEDIPNVTIETNNENIKNSSTEIPQEEEEEEGINDTNIMEDNSNSSESNKMEGELLMETPVETTTTTIKDNISTESNILIKSDDSENISDLPAAVEPISSDSVSSDSISSDSNEVAPMQSSEGLEIDMTNLTEFKMDVDVDFVVDGFSLDEDVPEPMDQ